MARIAAFLYGLLVYVLFVIVFCYAIGFVIDAFVPKTIDSGPQSPTAIALLINALLLGLFAVQHTIMARPAFKGWWCRFVPRPIERSTFVLVASLILALVMWQWRPLPTTIWHVEQPILRAILIGISLAGFLTVLYASFIIDHFDLFGLRQVYLYARRQKYSHPPFMERSLYKYVRHPLMVGFMVAFWSTPTMTLGHLLFAGLTTGYILVGVIIEERDLIRFVGQPYEQYRRRTPRFLPRPRPRVPAAAEQTQER